MPQVGPLALWDSLQITICITLYQIGACSPQKGISTLAPSAEDCAMQGITGPPTFWGFSQILNRLLWVFP